MRRGCLHPILQMRFWLALVLLATGAAAAGGSQALGRKSVLGPALLQLQPTLLRGDRREPDQGLRFERGRVQQPLLRVHGPGPQPRRGYRADLAKVYREKFRDRPIDLVITIHPDALQFLLDDAADLFPGLPVISVLGTAYPIEHSDPNRPLIVLPFSTDVAATVRNIAALQPGTRRLVVVSGSSRMDQRLAARVRAEIDALPPGLDVEHLAGIPMPAILERVAALPPVSAILYTSLYSDGTGATFQPVAAARAICAAASAPVFGLHETLLGDHGVVGGTLLDQGAEGERAVDVALEILRGRLPSEPLTVLPAPLVPMYDWRQLERWKLDASALPPGTVFLNRPESFWHAHRELAAAAAALFLLQSALIAALLAQRRSRRKAEAVIRESERELQSLTGRLILGQEAERRRLARELHDDLSQRLAALAIEAGQTEAAVGDANDPILGPLRELRDQTIRIAGDVHDISRRLHPSILDDLGLSKAVEAECARFAKREGVEVDFSAQGLPERVPPEAALALYRIVQEGLNNVAKHACARRVTVRLRGADASLHLTVADDGLGFDRTEVRRKPGLGLSSIRERVRLVRGRHRIDSRAEAGTTIEVAVPLTAATAGPTGAPGQKP
jgi:signal transduction histidine kinase